jgi:uncharacterized membrane protein YbhN (UPF0104 family)
VGDVAVDDDRTGGGSSRSTGSSAPGWVRGPAQRLLAARRPSARTERLLLLVASAAMVGGAWYALRQGAVDPSGFRWAPLLLAAALGVPLTAATNAGEYWITAQAAGATLRPMVALRTTILATAANLLPLPGGPLVRIQALRTEGIATGASTQVTAAAGTSWVAVAALLAAGGGAVVRAPHGAVVALAALGVVVGAVSVVLLRRATVHRVGWQRVLLRLVVVEVASVAISAARLYLLLLALGVPARASTALVLALAGVLATAVGVVPAGLGVREGLSALLAVAVALPAATGFAVSLLDRVVGLLVASPVALLLSWRTPHREAVR